MHDSAVQLECAGVPDSEIFQYIRQEFTQIFSLELPEEITGKLMRMQVAEHTEWEYALLAMRSAIEISMDAHPDRPGETGVDLQRRSAIRQFLMKQYPAMYDVLLHEQYEEYDSTSLLQVLQRYHKARHLAGPERFAGEPVLQTAPYGDPRALKLRQHQRDTDRNKEQNKSHSTNGAPPRRGGGANANLDDTASVLALRDTAAPNDAYRKQLHKQEGPVKCSNCGEQDVHYWAWCEEPYNEANAATARAANKPAPRDERHFTRVTKHIKKLGKPNPLARSAAASSRK
jgi:hypothetical protein